MKNLAGSGRIRDLGASSSLAAAFTAGTTAERIRFAIFVLVLTLCIIGGGSSRTDTLSLLYLRPALILFLAAFLLLPGSLDLRTVRWPLILLGAFCGTMLLQLIPLPPSLWGSLPGHAMLLDAATTAGIEQPWRPISINPDLTINSVIALLPALAVLIGYAGLRPDQRVAAMPLIIIAAIASAALGVLQYAGGPHSPAYIYQARTEGIPTGLFANRNHQAALRGIGILLVGAWLKIARLQPGQTQQWRLATAIFVVTVLLASIFATGSRSGMMLGLLACTAAIAMNLGRTGRSARHARWSNLAFMSFPLLLVLAMVVAGRAASLDRLLGADATSDIRFQSLPTLMRIIGEFMPFGSGFGTFDSTFRIFEPDSNLRPTYFNHAHNDWIELVLTGGAPALLICIGFILWAASALFKVLRSGKRDTALLLLAPSAAGIIILLGLASVSDYPIRTPMLTMLLALAAAWLSDAANAKTRPLSPTS